MGPTIYMYIINGLQSVFKTIVLKYSLYCVKCLILLLEHDFQTLIKHQFLHVLEMVYKMYMITLRELS